MRQSRSTAEENAARDQLANSRVVERERQPVPLVPDEETYAQGRREQCERPLVGQARAEPRPEPCATSARQRRAGVQHDDLAVTIVDQVHGGPGGTNGRAGRDHGNVGGADGNSRSRASTGAVREISPHRGSAGSIVCLVTTITG